MRFEVAAAAAAGYTGLWARGIGGASVAAVAERARYARLQPPRMPGWPAPRAWTQHMTSDWPD